MGMQQQQGMNMSGPAAGMPGTLVMPAGMMTTQTSMQSSVAGNIFSYTFFNETINLLTMKCQWTYGPT